jgi:hypothetical protein
VRVVLVLVFGLVLLLAMALGIGRYSLLDVCVSSYRMLCARRVSSCGYYVVEL